MNLATVIENFHFLRPLLLLALPLGLLFFFIVRRQLASQSSWQTVIDPQLLQFLIDRPATQKKRQWLGAALLTAWLIACVAMAGPAWERSQQPVVKNQAAYIVLLDLSLSMYAEDQKPSRLVHARRKIADLLAARKDGLTALIVYSGDAHIVAPLTDDSETINTLLPALEPQIMPKFGSNLPSALRKADKVLANGGINEAELVIFTDEITPAQFTALDQLDQQKFHVAILAFGSSDGAPIPLQNGFLKDKGGSTVLARLNWDDISAYARHNNLLAVQSGFDDQDIRLLLQNARHSDAHKASEGEFDLWQDNGHWLALLLLPFLLLTFRRGWILLALFIIWPDNSYALGWDDLWQTPDQQAAAAFARGDHKTAAEKFTDPQWKASADYKNGNYEAALEGFRKDDSAEGFYNQGNALARLGNLQEAIKAYDQALKKQPGLTDAASNKALVEKLLEQQKQEQNQQQNQGQDQEQQEENQQQQDGQQEQSQQDSAQQENEGQQGEQNSGQQNGQPQDSKQQGREEQDSDQHSEQQDAQSSPQDGQQQPADDAQQASSTEEQKNDATNREEQALNQAEQGENQEDSEEARQAMQASDAEMTPEEKEKQQALQQWLRKIPDEPGQLLRNKFRYQYEQNRRHNEHIDKDSEQLW